MRGCQAVWIDSLRVLLGVADLERALATIDAELRPIARADQRVQFLVTIPGVGDPLGLTIAAESGEISRFASARKLIGYARLAHTIKQSGQSSWTGRMYTPTRRRHGKGQPRDGRDRVESPDRHLAGPLAPTAVQTPRNSRLRSAPAGSR
jgi:transposase